MMVRAIDIENMTAAELKAQQAAVISGLEGESDLASRFVRARLDAKLRDEKLAEQGVTITELQSALQTVRQTAESLKSQLEQCEKERDSCQAQLEETKTLLNEARARGDRLKTEAIRNNAAITAAAQLLNEAVGQQLIEKAD